MEFLIGLAVGISIGGVGTLLLVRVIINRLYNHGDIAFRHKDGYWERKK